MRRTHPTGPNDLHPLAFWEDFKRGVDTVLWLLYFLWMLARRDRQALQIWREMRDGP